MSGETEFLDDAELITLANQLTDDLPSDPNIPDSFFNREWKICREGREGTRVIRVFPPLQTLEEMMRDDALKK